MAYIGNLWLAWTHKLRVWCSPLLLSRNALHTEHLTTILLLWNKTLGCVMFTRIKFESIKSFFSFLISFTFTGSGIQKAHNRSSHHSGDGCKNFKTAVWLTSEISFLRKMGLIIELNAVRRNHSFLKRWMFESRMSEHRDELRGLNAFLC